MSDPPADTTRASGRKRVIWDDSKSRNVYADAFNVMSSREEISLLLGTRQAGQKEDNTVKVELTDRVALSPFAAKRFAIQLNNVIRQYESRFGYLEGNAVVQERLEPTPALQPPLFRSAKGVEKVSLLFQFLDDLKIMPAFERSWEFLEKRLLEKRFLLGFEKKMIQQHP